MYYPVTIQTDRLRLRPLTLADAEAFFRYRARPEVCRYQSFQPKSLAEIETFLRQNERADPNAPGTWYQLAVCLDDGTLIGDIGLHTLDAWQLELGYTLAPEHQHNGYATEAVTAVVREAFSSWNTHRICASVDPENEASIRLLERIGFRKEAHFRKSFRQNGEWFDDCVYALLREDRLIRERQSNADAPSPSPAASVEICEGYSHLEQIRALFAEYAASLGIDLGYQQFPAELEGLPGKYARPDGRLYLALVDGAPAGCVALRRFDATRAEMKRLYVRPAYRRLHLGSRLAGLVVEAARESGYSAILLDTLHTMDRAKQLYRRLGFVEIEPYYDSPVGETTFLQLTLAPFGAKNDFAVSSKARPDKHLYIVGGTMGVGKTATCLCLNRRLPNSVFLDGDWCWFMHPFQVTEETKKLVQDNIGFLLNQFLQCSAYDNVVFCWVLQEQSILDDLLARLNTANCAVHLVSLVCEQQALIRRIQKDVDAGIRAADTLERSVARLPFYASLRTDLLDVTDITPEEAAAAIQARYEPV